MKDDRLLENVNNKIYIVSQQSFIMNENRKNIIGFVEISPKFAFTKGYSHHLVSQLKKTLIISNRCNGEGSAIKFQQEWLVNGGTVYNLLYVWAELRQLNCLKGHTQQLVVPIYIFHEAAVIEALESI